MFFCPGIRDAFSNPPVIIFASFDIVFTEVGAGLHFDENEGCVCFVLNPMPCPSGDIHTLPGGKCDFFFFADDDGLSGYDVPVLRSVHVTLQAEAMSRLNHYPLDLVVHLISQYREISPRPMVRIILGHPVPQKNGASGKGAVYRLAKCYPGLLVAGEGECMPGVVGGVM